MKDAVDTAYDVISAGWTADNTNSRTPSFIKAHEAKYVSVNENDKLMLYYTSGNEVLHPDILDNQEDELGYVSVKILTKHSESNPKSEDHAKLMIDEVERIRKANRSDPDSNWHKWDRVRGPIADHAHSQKYAGGLWTYTIDYVMKKWSIDITS